MVSPLYPVEYDPSVSRQDPPYTWGQVTEAGPDGMCVRIAGDIVDVVIRDHLGTYLAEAGDTVLIMKVGAQWVLAGKITTGGYYQPTEATVVDLTNYYTRNESDDRFLTETEGDGRYSRDPHTHPDYLTGVPGEYLTQSEGDGRYLQEIPPEYLTESEGDGRYSRAPHTHSEYLTGVPAEYLTETEGDGRYLRTVPAEYLTQSEGDGRYIRSIPPEYLTANEGDSRYLQSIPGEYLTEPEGDARYARDPHTHDIYLTETEGDGRYLQAVPAEYLTESEGDSRYLQSVPGEYLTQSEGDGRYLREVPDEYLTETEADNSYAPDPHIHGIYLTDVPPEYLTEGEGDARYARIGDIPGEGFAGSAGADFEIIKVAELDIRTDGVIGTDGIRYTGSQFNGHTPSIEGFLLKANVERTMRPSNVNYLDVATLRSQMRSGEIKFAFLRFYRAIVQNGFFVYDPVKVSATSMQVVYTPESNLNVAETPGDPLITDQLSDRVLFTYQALPDSEEGTTNVAPTQIALDLDETTLRIEASSDWRAHHDSTYTGDPSVNRGYFRVSLFIIKTLALEIPDEYLTESEGDVRYPAAAHGHTNYLGSVPDEYLTQTEGDARYLRAAPDSAGADFSVIKVGELDIRTDGVVNSTGDTVYTPAEYIGTTPSFQGYLLAPNTERSMRMVSSDYPTPASLRTAILEGDIKFLTVRVFTGSTNNLNATSFGVSPRSVASSQMQLAYFPATDERQLFNRFLFHLDTPFNDSTVLDAEIIELGLDTNETSLNIESPEALLARGGTSIPTANSSLFYRISVYAIKTVQVDIPPAYLTQLEGDSRYAPIVHAHPDYLTSIPQEYLTQQEGDDRYLQAVPDEYLTQAEGDARYGTGQVNMDIVKVAELDIRTDGVMDTSNNVYTPEEWILTSNDSADGHILRPLVERPMRLVDPGYPTVASLRDDMESGDIKFLFCRVFRGRVTNLPLTTSSTDPERFEVEAVNYATSDLQPVHFPDTDENETIDRVAFSMTPPLSSEEGIAYPTDISIAVDTDESTLNIETGPGTLISVESRTRGSVTHAIQGGYYRVSLYVVKGGGPLSIPDEYLTQDEGDARYAMAGEGGNRMVGMDFVKLAELDIREDGVEDSSGNLYTPESYILSSSSSLSAYLLYSNRERSMRLVDPAYTTAMSIRSAMESGEIKFLFLRFFRGRVRNETNPDAFNIYETYSYLATDMQPVFFPDADENATIDRVVFSIQPVALNEEAIPSQSALEIAIDTDESNINIEAPNTYLAHTNRGVNATYSASHFKVALYGVKEGAPYQDHTHDEYLGEIPDEYLTQDEGDERYQRKLRDIAGADFDVIQVAELDIQRDGVVSSQGVRFRSPEYINHSPNFWGYLLYRNQERAMRLTHSDYTSTASLRQAMLDGEIKFLVARLFQGTTRNNSDLTFGVTSDRVVSSQLQMVYYPDSSANDLVDRVQFKIQRTTGEETIPSDQDIIIGFDTDEAHPNIESGSDLLARNGTALSNVAGNAYYRIAIYAVRTDELEIPEDYLTILEGDERYSLTTHIHQPIDLELDPRFSNWKAAQWNPLFDGNIAEETYFPEVSSTVDTAPVGRYPADGSTSLYGFPDGFHSWGVLQQIAYWVRRFEVNTEDLWAMMNFVDGQNGANYPGTNDAATDVTFGFPRHHGNSELNKPGMRERIVALEFLTGVRNMDEAYSAWVGIRDRTTATEASNQTMIERIAALEARPAGSGSGGGGSAEMVLIGSLDVRDDGVVPADGTVAVAPTPWATFTQASFQTTSQQNFNLWDYNANSNTRPHNRRALTINTDAHATGAAARTAIKDGDYDLLIVRMFTATFHSTDTGQSITPNRWFSQAVIAPKDIVADDRQPEDDVYLFLLPAPEIYDAASQTQPPVSFASSSYAPVTVSIDLTQTGSVRIGGRGTQWQDLDLRVKQQGGTSTNILGVPIRVELVGVKLGGGGVSAGSRVEKVAEIDIITDGYWADGPDEIRTINQTVPSSGRNWLLPRANVERSLRWVGTTYSSAPDLKEAISEGTVKRLTMRYWYAGIGNRRSDDPAGPPYVVVSPYDARQAAADTRLVYFGPGTDTAMTDGVIFTLVIHGTNEESPPTNTGSNVQIRMDLDETTLNLETGLEQTRMYWGSSIPNPPSPGFPYGTYNYPLILYKIAVYAEIEG